MTATDDRKICGLCGEDCSDRPRTRDRGGRYFCNKCYEEAAARKTSGRTDTAMLADTHDVDATVLAAILEDTSSHDSPPPDPDPVCKRCGKALEKGTSVCSRCGQRAKSPGRSAKSPTASEANSSSSKPDFSVPAPSKGPSWHIPTWIVIGVPLVFIVAIVYAAMPRSRRARVTPPPPTVTPDASRAQAPDLQDPQSFENGAIRFRFPGNWRLATDYPGFDREKYVVVDGGGDAQIIIRVIGSTDTLEAELQTRLEELNAFGSGYTDREQITKYGALEGAGREVTTYLGNRPVRHRVFLTKLSIHNMLEVQEICPNPRLEHADPGFDFFAKSLLAK